MKNKKPIYLIVLALYLIALINIFTWYFNLTKFYWLSWVIVGLFVFITAIQVAVSIEDKRNKK